MSAMKSEEVHNQRVKIQLDNSWRNEKEGTLVTPCRGPRDEGDRAGQGLGAGGLGERDESVSRNDVEGRRPSDGHVLSAADNDGDEGCRGGGGGAVAPRGLRQQRSRSSRSSGSSAENRSSSSSSTTRCRPRRPRISSPPPGVFAEGQCPPQRLPTRAQEAGQDVYRVKFVQVCDDPKWSAERVLMPFGTDALFLQRPILAFRTHKTPEKVISMMDELADKKFRVYCDHPTRTFSGRTPKPQAAPQMSPKAKASERKKPPLAEQRRPGKKQVII